jgi:predicted N-acetyltransferase YhbS
LTLGDGLVLRSGKPEDTDALLDWISDAFREEDGSEDAPLLAWVRDLQRGHPTFTPDLWRVVEETDTGRIVSGLCLIPQTWRYEGIELPVGLVEIVGTRPGYRRRGLVGALMDEIHVLSAARGDLVQAISGIPWFYRQFGYEMALSMHGGRGLCVADVPEAGEPESFSFREATVADAPFLEEALAPTSDRYLVTCPRDRDLWESQLADHDPGSVASRCVEVIERAGTSVGTIGWSPVASEGTLWATHAEVVPGVSWGEAGPVVLRRLAALAGVAGAGDIRLALGEDHPMFTAMWHLLGESIRPYAWYVRVADVVALLRRLAPVLEWRLNDGPFENHTGTLCISWYRSGVRLVLDGGLLEVEEWSPCDEERGDLAFPGLTFLSLVFGHRSLQDLRAAHPDCSFWTPSAAPLADALFPPRPSWVWQMA